MARILSYRETAKRLRYAAGLIEKVPDEKFEMGNWCGTAKCVAGHLASSPKGRYWGLRVSQGRVVLGSKPDMVPGCYQSLVDIRPSAQKAFQGAVGCTLEQAKSICYSTHLSKTQMIRKLTKMAEAYDRKHGRDDK